MRFAPDVPGWVTAGSAVPSRIAPHRRTETWAECLVQPPTPEPPSSPRFAAVTGATGVPARAAAAIALTTTRSDSTEHRSAERVDPLDDRVDPCDQGQPRRKAPAVSLEPTVETVDLGHDPTGPYEIATSGISTNSITPIAQITTASTLLELELPLSPMSFTASRYSGDGRNMTRPTRC